jgi:hypothetical protein
LLNSAPPDDPDWTAQLEKERQEEIHVIGGACDALGREIYEVSYLHTLAAIEAECREGGQGQEQSANERSHLMGIVCLMQSRINSIY